MRHRTILLLLILIACAAPAAAPGAVVSGNRVQWQAVTIDFDGPLHDEMDSSPNPFLDYRLQVDFLAPISGTVYSVPGYFDGDGDGGSSGSVWRVRFTPDEPGTWSYTASFRSGTEVAVDLDPAAGAPASFDGETGQFTVAEVDRGAPGFLRRGRLESVGQYYLEFREGGYWTKLGTNNPENLLGYEGFDNTPFAWHSYANHVADWQPGDPDWDSPDTPSPNDGRGIIGALNYLVSLDLNSIYFMPMNIGADGKDTWPYASTTIDRDGSSSNDNLHFDVSKLAQWGIVLDHAQRIGLFLHFVLGDRTIPNKNELDNATLGVERKLFYRELVARFGHHNALQWNISEEYNLDLPLDPAVVKQFGEYIAAIDPYDSPITVHPHGNTYQAALAPFLADDWFKIMSVQTWQRPEDISNAIEYFRDETAAVGNPIPVMIDESIGMNQMSADEYRKRTHWDALLSGGGFEMFKSQGDSEVDDFRVYEAYYVFARHTLNFVEAYLPYWTMEPADELVTGEDGIHGGAEVFIRTGDYYAIYLPSGQPEPNLLLTGIPGPFDRRWFNPRTGQFEGEIDTIAGGANIKLGIPPSSPDDDWVVLLRNVALPPLRREGAPAGTLLSGTTSTTISIETDVAAECRHATVPGVDFGSMTSVFAITGGEHHETTVIGLEDGRAYAYYVRCSDGDANPDDYVIEFTVAPAGDPLVGDRAVWFLDDDAGSIASDSSGQGNDGALVDAPQWVPGKIGPGLSFDGTASYVQIADAPSLDFHAWSGASVAMWARPERVGHVDDQTLYGHWNALTAKRPLQVLLTPTDRLQCRTNHHDGEATAPSGVIAGEWVHIACVWTPDGLDLYVDGTLVATDGTVQAPLQDNAGVHTFGARDKSGELSQYYLGDLDEVHVFSRGLTATEVLGLYGTVDCARAGTTVFGQTVLAADRDTLSWSNPADVDWIAGDLADVGFYGVTDSGSFSAATSLDISTQSPGPGSGVYFLVRDDGCGSWQTAPGAEPERDGSLPAP